MKIEFLEKTGDASHNNILRIFAFNQDETLVLRSLIEKFILEQKKDLKIHSLDFVEEINCKLTMTRVNKNIGVSQINSTEFKWELNTEQCTNVCEMLENSIRTSGFYWLDGDDCETDVDLLFSEGGGW